MGRSKIFFWSVEIVVYIVTTQVFEFYWFYLAKYIYICVLHVSNIGSKRHCGGPKIRFFSMIEIFDMINASIIELAGQKWFFLEKLSLIYGKIVYSSIKIEFTSKLTKSI